MVSYTPGKNLRLIQPLHITEALQSWNHSCESCLHLVHLKGILPVSKQHELHEYSKCGLSHVLYNCTFVRRLFALHLVTFEHTNYSMNIDIPIHGFVSLLIFNINQLKTFL